MQYKFIKLSKKIVLSRIFIGAVMATVCLLAMLFVYFAGKKDLVVFSDSSRFHYSLYTDSSVGGNSQIIDHVLTDSAIKIDFRLRKGFLNPYIGISATPKGSPSINLSYYNQLCIKVKSKKIPQLGIAIFSPNPYPKVTPQSPEISYYSTLNVSPEAKTYQLDLSQFKVPDWWNERYGLDINDRQKPDLKNVVRINIGNAYSPIIGERETIEIYALYFTRDNTRLLIGLLVLALSVIFILFSVLFLVSAYQENKKAVTITYKPIEDTSNTDGSPEFMAFINNHFQNSQLTLEFVSEKIGISQRKVANYIQEQFACNFKGYINRLRINESKRLLIETSLNIGEVAFKVGFNNQSHFNRVFKSMVGLSPSEFKGQKQ